MNADSRQACRTGDTPQATPSNRGRRDDIACILRVADDAADGIIGVGVQAMLVAMAGHWDDHVRDGHKASRIVADDLSGVIASLTETARRLQSELDSIERRIENTAQTHIPPTAGRSHEPEVRLNPTQQLNTPHGAAD